MSLCIYMGKDHNKLDLTDQKFGLLTALKRAHQNKQGSYYWLCKCQCR